MEKIKELIEKVKCTFRNICDTIKNIKSEIDFYKGIWDDPRGNAVIKKTLGEAWFLVKKVKPSKIEGDIIFGTGDPATTGQALGVLGALYGFLPEKLNITPDFENRIYEGTIHIKGKLRLFHVAKMIVKLIIDKNFRYVVKKVLTKEGAKNEQQ